MNQETESFPPPPPQFLEQNQQFSVPKRTSEASSVLPSFQLPSKPSPRPHRVPPAAPRNQQINNFDGKRPKPPVPPARPR